MLIRSQNKKGITNLNNIDTIEVHDCQIRYYCGGVETAGLLGKYSTEEKAIKVLDMIQDAYNAIETMKVDKCAWRDNHYFQMPSDEEVEV